MRRSRWWNRAVVSSAVAGGAALAGCVMARPARTAPLAAPSELAVQSVSFASRSGSTVRGWLLRGEPRGGSVLLLHGVGDNRTSMVGRARFLHRLGYTVLLPDFQAHGESTGEHITFGALESFDAEAALAFLRQCDVGSRVAVIGVSMGGAATLLGPGPLHADALVLESVYPTIRQALEDRLKAWMGPLGLLNHRIAPFVLRSVSAEIGVSEAALQPIEQIGRVASPVLVLAGSRDRYTPLDETRALFARAPEPKSLWVVEGAGHEDLHAYAGADYERRVGTFLARYLRDGAVGPPPRATSSSVNAGGRALAGAGACTDAPA